MFKIFCVVVVVRRDSCFRLHKFFQLEQAEILVGQMLDLLRCRVHVIKANWTFAVPQLAIDEPSGDLHRLTIGRRICFAADDFDVAHLDSFHAFLEWYINRRFFILRLWCGLGFASGLRLFCG